MARVLLCHSNDAVAPALDIALSERNLIILLSKLYTPGSACSFMNTDVPHGFSYATFRAEPDELHYMSPTRGGHRPAPCILLPSSSTPSSRTYSTPASSPMGEKRGRDECVERLKQQRGANRSERRDSRRRRVHARLGR